MKNRIFLGGTCNQTTWRGEMIPHLDPAIEYFNPVVEDWTPECQAQEIDEKENKCNIHYYCLTSNMAGVFSVAEVVDSAHNNSVRTILHVMPEGFDKKMLKSLDATIDLVNSRGGIAFSDDDLNRSVQVINSAFA